MTELCSGFNAGIAFHSHYPRDAVRAVAPSGDGAASVALGATQLISGVCIRNAKLATATETASSPAWGMQHTLANFPSYAHA